METQNAQRRSPVLAISIVALAILVMPFFWYQIVRKQSQHFDQLSDAQKGEVMLRELGCRSCHRLNDPYRAPPLEGLMGRTVYFIDGNYLQANQDYVWESLMEPHKRVARGYQAVMPHYKGQIDEQSFTWIMAYLQKNSLQPQP